MLEQEREEDEREKRNVEKENEQNETTRGDFTWRLQTRGAAKKRGRPKYVEKKESEKNSSEKSTFTGGGRRVSNERASNRRRQTYPHLLKWRVLTLCSKNQAERNTFAWRVLHVTRLLKKEREEKIEKRPRSANFTAFQSTIAMVTIALATYWSGNRPPVV